MHKKLATLLLALLFAACTTTLPSVDLFETLLPTPASPPVPVAVARPTATATLSPVAIPTRNLDIEPLRPSVIFQAVSPSVAFIDTEDSSGSAVLLEGGYLLTNAHVVWPKEKVRVVFADGVEIEDAPVYNWDLMADLALIGPIEVDEPPLALVDGEDLIIGSDVYLIGYPGEVEEFPQPTISRGLISRLREWKPLNLTYFQSDATIAGGQSGGVLVSEIGEVIGISGFGFANNEFALVASAADLAPLVERMKEDTERTALISNRLSKDKASTQHEFTFGREPADLLLVFELGEDDIVTGSDPEEEEEKELDFEVEFAGGGDVAVYVQPAWGYSVGSAFLQNDQDDTITFVPRTEGLYFVRISRPENFDPEDATGTLILNADIDLTPYRELEEGLESLVVGDKIAGYIDYQGDVDVYTLSMKAGEVVYLLAESILVDPTLLVAIPQLDVDYADNPFDDDTGGGLFGTDAELSYKAPQDGLYYVLIEDYGSGPGGYFITVDRPAEDAPTPMAPPPTATPIISAFGAVQQYTSEGKVAFQIQAPADWSTTIRADGFANVCQATLECYGNPRNSLVLSIGEEDLNESGFGDMDLEEYIDLTIEALENQPGSKVISRNVRTNALGYEIEELELSLANDLVQLRRMTYVEDGVAFTASFLYAGRSGSEMFPPLTEDERADLDDLVRNVFDSFQIKE